MGTANTPHIQFSEDIVHNMVVSHRGGELNVHSVCHHSGRYLTRSEYSRGIESIPLHEHHDFPGMPELDNRFRVAAHDVDFRHLSWSRIGVRAVGFMLSALLLVAGVVALLSRLDFVANVFEALGFLGITAVGIVLAVVMLFRGIRRLMQRTQLFHEWARQALLVPAVPEFPVLDCHYQLEAVEHYKIELTNIGDASTGDPVSRSEGRLVVLVDPHERVPEQFEEYCKVYHVKGAVPTFAGVIALDGLNSVRFVQPATEHLDATTGLDQSHRVLLRSSAVTPSDIRSLTHLFDYQVKRAVLYSPVDVATDVTEIPQLFDEDDDRSKLTFECIPELDPLDSRKLYLTFRWLGRSDVNWLLEECRITIPPELGDALLVERGRIDRTGEKSALWRNLPLNGQLRLSVRFVKPILKETPVFRGTYRLHSNELVSGLNMQGSRVWDAMGMPADTSVTANIVIRRESVVEGGICLATSQLTHLHEVVIATQLRVQRKADHDLVGAFVQALVATGVQVQRTEQSRPHVDPSDENNTQIAYWDVTGRSYRPGRLDPIDIHAVVAGRHAAQGRAETESSATNTGTIELRLRCLHDPRNSRVEEEVKLKMHELVDSLQKQLSVDVVFQN